MGLMPFYLGANEMNLTSMSTIISGYLVELDTDNESTQCFVTYRDKSGRTYFASLAALMDYGVLEDSQSRPRRVPASTIDRITEWAVYYGY